MHLNSISYLRAFAIIFIVMGHGFALAGHAPLDWPSRFATNIVTGGTACFVFISGYMFHHVFSGRFHYRKFLLSKMRRILVPYLSIAVPVTVYFVARNSYFAEEMLGLSPASLQVIKVLLTGSVFQAYWFIPFILVMFLLSPVHLRFLGLSTIRQVSIVIALTAFAMMIHRPMDNLNILQSLIYFTPVYLIGMMTSLNRRQLLERIRGRELLLWAATLLMVALQTSIGQLGNEHRAFFAFLAFDSIDLMLPQKLLLTLASFATLERYSSWQSPALLRIADASFAIFFLHPIALILIEKANSANLWGSSWADLASITVQAILISLVIALVARHLFAGRSRLVVGY